MSSPDKPSSPLPGEHRTPSGDKLMATLSESGSPKLAEAARVEIAKALEEKRQSDEVTPSASVIARKEVSREVTEATTKFTDGVDVITETLILILGKFKTIVWRTNIGVVFGACVFITCLLVARQAQKAALLQEENARKVSVLADKLNETLSRLDKIQQSTVSTEQKVDAVKDAKPSIEIVPDQKRPGEAKVVIRQSAPLAPPPSAAPSPPPLGFGEGHGRLGGGAKPAAREEPPPPPPVQSVVEIPLQLKNVEQRSAE